MINSTHYWNVARLVLFDDGVVNAVGAIGFLLFYEVEMTVFGYLVMVVPLDPPRFGEGVVFEIKVGECHHAVHGEMACIIEGDAGISGVETVAAEAHRALMLSGVKSAQIDAVDTVAVFVNGHQMDLKVVGVFAQRL